jgi:hypothetical protein
MFLNFKQRKNAKFFLNKFIFKKLKNGSVIYLEFFYTQNFGYKKMFSAFRTCS